MEQTGHFQIVLWKVAQILMLLAFVMVIIIFFTQIFKNGLTDITVHSVIATLKLCLVLLVASIPIAMQVVCTGTMAVGARALADKNAIVARLSAIEELAGMDVLCSDKTGTLTQNKLRIDRPWTLHTNQPTSVADSLPEMNVDEEACEKDVVFFGALASQWEGSKEAIDTAITNAAKYEEERAGGGRERKGR